MCIIFSNALSSIICRSGHKYSEDIKKKKTRPRDFPGGPGAKLHAFKALEAWSSGSIPGQGTRIPHAACSGQKKT